MFRYAICCYEYVIDIGVFRKEFLLSLPQAEQQLRDLLLNGLAAEIFWADEAKSLVAEIGKHAAAINHGSFGAFFGPLQVILSDRQTLNVVKLFEPPNRRYPTRSIPSVLVLLEQYASLWQIAQPHVLHQLLEKAGWAKSEVVSLDNTDLTRAVIDYYRSTVPTIEATDTSPLVPALRALRESRDKVIAHNEAIDRASRQPVTWEETELLVNFAKDFVTTISFAYLGLYIGTNHADYLVSFDARKSSRTLRQLLKAANIAREDK